MTFRVAYAGFMLESVTAVPVISEIADFERHMVRGAALAEGFRGTNSVAGGSLGVLEAAADVTVLPLLQTMIGALGPASDAAIAWLAGEFTAAFRAAGPLDGVVLYLHGACWAPGYPDVERHFIDLVRGLVGDIPVVVALDYHGNVDQQSFGGCDAVVAYRHSPHIDMGETGARAATALLRMLRERRRPGVAVCRPGIVIPSIMSATALRPLADVIARARAIEAASDCDINIMGGFSYADSPNTGMSVIVTDWAGQAAAEAKARDLAQELHDLRAQISGSVPCLSVEAALDEIAARPGQGKPVVLLEHADRMNDSTYVLRALLQRDLGRVNVPFLFDPVTAAQAVAAGAGAEIEVAIGGRSSEASGGPVMARAKVVWAGDKSYTISGRMLQGTRVDLGATALLDIGQVRVSVVSAFAFAVDGDPFYIFGETPADYDVILLRSKTHFRDFYEPCADRIIVVDTPDLGPADVRRIAYAQLDTSAAWPWCETPILSR